MTALTLDEALCSLLFVGGLVGLAATKWLTWLISCCVGWIGLILLSLYHDRH